jgi:CHAT domain-containing protein
MEESGPKLSDVAISSYTPTLTALLRASHATNTTPFKLLVTSLPETPNQPDLPNASEELRRIKVSKQDAHTIVSLDRANATVKRVAEAMAKDCSWVHFACHGKQNIRNPEKSALILEDGDLLLSTISQNVLPHAKFAFLSACQTATGDEDLPEEALHLASGMLIAGYSSVIATMWSIKDRVAPEVAGLVYQRLLKDEQPDHTQAAYALHEAVRELHRQKEPLLNLIPFIHFGV